MAADVSCYSTNESQFPPSKLNKQSPAGVSLLRNAILIGFSGFSNPRVMIVEE